MKVWSSRKTQMRLVTPMRKNDKVAMMAQIRGSVSLLPLALLKLMLIAILSYSDA